MVRSTLAALLGLSLTSVDAHISAGREGYGVIGYGIEMYNPPCAFACKDTVSGWTLDCPMDHDDMEGMEGMHHGPSAECLTSNDIFLQTLAYCVHTHCPDSSVETIEEFWKMSVAGRKEVQPEPKYSYEHALSLVVDPPTEVLDAESVLNVTSLVDEEAWLGNFNGDYGFETMEIVNEKYGIVLIATCVLIPIVFSWLRFLPFPQSLISKFYAHAIDPPVFGKYHAVPVLGLGFVPTRGQALFIAYIWIINIILCSVGYKVMNPMSWYSTLDMQLMAYIGNRTGLLSFVNLAIAIIFSSRNNLLLYITSWSYSTFLLIHRWVAVICMLQACLHSAIYLQMYLELESYSEESKLEYWIWGIIATFALVFLMPLSILPLRRKMYEVFLASHVVLAFLAMLGCVLHMFYRYELQWGYQTWPIIALAIWGFDRIVARPLRLLEKGVKRAMVTIIDEDYIKVEIPFLESEGQVYLYFPTLTWRVWENHPFSVAASPGWPGSDEYESSSDSIRSRPDSEDLEKDKITSATARPIASTRSTTPGAVFYLRRRGGLTAKLVKNAELANGLPVLVESSYGAQMSLLQSTKRPLTKAYPNLICVAGGVGISAVLPVLRRASNSSRNGAVKLFWGVREKALVRATEGLLGQPLLGEESRRIWGNVDVAISVGERFNLKEVLEAQIDSTSGGTTVLVCGPGGMADDVRNAIVSLGQKGKVVRLIQESFDW